MPGRRASRAQGTLETLPGLRTTRDVKVGPGRVNLKRGRGPQLPEGPSLLPAPTLSLRVLHHTKEVGCAVAFPFPR